MAVRDDGFVCNKNSSSHCSACHDRRAAGRLVRWRWDWTAKGGKEMNAEDRTLVSLQRRGQGWRRGRRKGSEMDLERNRGRGRQSG